MAGKGTFHDGEYWYSSHGVDYTVRHHEYRDPTSDVELPCPGYMAFQTGDGTLEGIPCHLISKEEDYYQIQGQQFAASLRSHYPHISTGCAARVTESFMEIIRIANATHDCIACQPGVPFIDITHIVVVKIQPHHHAAVEKEAVGPMRWPATRASVVELLLKATNSSTTAQYEECAICMEESKSKTLAMPCSHSFHQACLLPWLDHNHSCPLCRCQLPSAVYRSFS